MIHNWLNGYLFNIFNSLHSVITQCHFHGFMHILRITGTIFLCIIIIFIFLHYYVSVTKIKRIKKPILKDKVVAGTVRHEIIIMSDYKQKVNKESNF